MANKSFLIKVNQEDKIMLERIKKATNIPFSKILRYLLNLYFQDENISDSIVIQKYKFYSNEKHTISIKLTREEYENLKTLCKENGFSSITKQAKYLLLNSIHKEKFFKNNEIEHFIKIRSEMAKDYSNLYQLLKALRGKNLIKINDEVLINMINNINTNTQIILESFGKIVEKNKERI
ncbi:hypothetical protein QRV79_001440 [Campylobacter coli]|uniref:Uncharacterized protein n=1 Tax=Campylobacter coli TaxID=195 RepID=A0A691X246_CAMCO|nr:hypothetical protein [Campylobacter coli]EAI5942615.1 hypothetical protein [Campylobacter coli]EAJ3599201.1 hypothetical protein [Campylobacter coli]EAJ4278339.1 hypothetical protein [Campylobacter coli]EAJ9508620.1 hypothetical protein [Campylobacter coli]EAK2928142.1 hypothetical protein [Campylobacter coli]